MSDIKVTVTFKREEVEDYNAGVSYLEHTASNYAGCTPDEIAKYVAQDRDRLAAYHRGDWHMIGIRAVATIWISRPGYSTCYTLESPGVWGIESDSGEDYLNEVYQEECAQLRDDIEAFKLAGLKS
jgi:hypothetical protein